MINKTVLFLIFTGLISCKSTIPTTYVNLAPKTVTLNGERPIIIGHRGAPGYMPEHTIEGYTKAIMMGADYIEPDLVMSKDGFLVVRHEPMLSGTTNVADIPAFASKKTSKNIDGKIISDWFVSDFTLAEIKQLKAKQAFSERNQKYNNLYSIVTFGEVLALAKQKSKELGRTIGVYPETKHPSFHEALNLHITAKLLEELSDAGWNNAEAPVYIQSFEVSNLQYIRKISNVKTIQLVGCSSVALNGDLEFTIVKGEMISDVMPYDWFLKNDSRNYGFFKTNEGLDFVKTYASGVGFWKPFIISFKGTDENNDGVADDVNGNGKIEDSDKVALPPSDLISRAHKRGLVVNVYTFRNESQRLLRTYNDDPVLEYLAFYNLGVDGVFSDFSDTAVQARKLMK